MVIFSRRLGIARQTGRFRRGEPEAAVPVVVQVVLAFFGKEFQGAAKSAACGQGASKTGIGGLPFQKIGLPAQLGGRVGVGVGDEEKRVQGGDPPVHRRIGRKPCFQSVDVWRQILKAFLYGVKAGEGPEKGKMRRPNMGQG